MKVRYGLAALVALVGMAGMAMAAPVSAEPEPGVPQGSTNAVEIDGVTIAMETPDGKAAPADYICYYEHLCTYHNGQFQHWYYCERVWLSNWTGYGYAFNNQTPGTTSYFYNQDGSLNFPLPDGVTSYHNWDPIWSFQVC